MLTRLRPGQSAATFLWASRNSLSRPGFTRNRTALKAVMRLPPCRGVRIMQKKRKARKNGSGRGRFLCNPNQRGSDVGEMKHQGCVAVRRLWVEAVWKRLIATGD